jgi:hypothetical protein
MIMEQCPNCKNWTVFYNPQSEEKICCVCNNKIVLKYADYIKAENVSDSLFYPSTLVESLVKPLATLPK